MVRLKKCIRSAFQALDCYSASQRYIPFPDTFHFYSYQDSERDQMNWSLGKESLSCCLYTEGTAKQ